MGKRAWILGKSDLVPGINQKAGRIYPQCFKKTFQWFSFSLVIFLLSLLFFFLSVVTVILTQEVRLHATPLLITNFFQSLTQTLCPKSFYLSWAIPWALNISFIDFSLLLTILASFCLALNSNQILYHHMQIPSFIPFPLFHLSYLKELTFCFVNKKIKRIFNSSGRLYLGRLTFFFLVFSHFNIPLSF